MANLDTAVTAWLKAEADSASAATGIEALSQLETAAMAANCLYIAHLAHSLRSLYIEVGGDPTGEATVALNAALIEALAD